ncbi:hypothetical protein [Bosea massiliensis]|uniref:Uncharacterized protein n=1 Tax=Bosea massiliensis TaxID=151419 RepID=A0ABW0P9S2_9HYPH
MQMRISNIQWDTDEEHDVDLPSEVIADTKIDPVGDHETIANWLSDKFGWAVISFSSDQLA